MLKSFFKLLTRCYRLALPFGGQKFFAVLERKIARRFISLIDKV